MRRSLQLGLGAAWPVSQASHCEMSHKSSTTNTILGDWYLLASTGVNVPLHHMDLRFKNVSGELRGAIVSRVDGSEIPLASSEFDGSTLRFKLVAPNGKTQSEMPTMVMTWNGVRWPSGPHPPSAGLSAMFRVPQGLVR